jgi:multidrug efflux pump subunit AcrA (membrane-fusion protein)
MTMRTIVTTKLNSRNLHFWLAATVLVLLTSVGCGKSKVQAAPAMPVPLVSVVRASAQDVPTVSGRNRQKCGLRIGHGNAASRGRIVERHFQDGENLNRGQLLFVIDPRPYQAQVDLQRRHPSRRPRRRSTSPKIQFTRDQEVIGAKAISKQDLRHEKECGGCGSGAGRIRRSSPGNREAQPGVLLHSLSHRWPSRRPFGRCGNVVQPNTTSLLSIQRLDPIYANFTITESDLPRVQKQMSAGTLKAVVRFPRTPKRKPETAASNSSTTPCRTAAAQ